MAVVQTAVLGVFYGISSFLRVEIFSLMGSKWTSRLTHDNVEVLFGKVLLVQYILHSMIERMVKWRGVGSDSLVGD